MEQSRWHSRWGPSGIAIALIAAALTLPGSAAPASSHNSGKVVASRANELSPAAGSDVLAWSKDNRRRGLRVKALARYEGQRIRLSKRGTNGLVGGVDGTRVAFVQFHGKRSNIRVVDVATDKEVPLYRLVNTNSFETRPSISGDWMLYGNWTETEPFPRVTPRRSSIVLRNFVTGERATYETVRRPRLLIPGQVNGRWASWTRCGKKRCAVYRYDLAERKKVKIAVSRRALYAASTTPDGTVYFTRSGRRCGRHVRIVRAGIDGSRRIEARLPRGTDLFRTFAHVTGDGESRILYDRLKCKNFRADLYATSHETLEDLSDSPSDVVRDRSTTHQANEMHDGRILDPSIEFPLEMKWTRPDLDRRISYPLIADGRVFVATLDDRTNRNSIHALNAETGKPEWSRTFRGRFWSALAYENDGVFVVTSDGFVHAFDAVTGSSWWSREVNFSFSTAPVAKDGRLYISGSTGSRRELDVLSQRSGAALWSYADGGAGGSPAIAGSNIFVADRCSNAIGMDRFAKELLWRRDTSCIGPGGRTVAFHDSRVYARTGSDGVILDAEDGDALGTVDAVGAIAFSDETMFYRVDDHLEARHAVLDTQIWTFEPPEAVTSDPIVVNDHVIVGTDDGTLYALDRLTGIAEWSYTGEEIGPVPRPAEGYGPYPLQGLGAGEGILVVPGWTTLTAFSSAG